MTCLMKLLQRMAQIPKQTHKTQVYNIWDLYNVTIKINFIDLLSNDKTGADGFLWSGCRGCDGVVSPVTAAGIFGIDDVEAVRPSSLLRIMTTVLSGVLDPTDELVLDGLLLWGYKNQNYI